MAEKLTKSRTFAVIPPTGSLDVFFLWRTTTHGPPTGGNSVNGHDRRQEKKLEWNTTRLPWPTSDLDAVVNLLTKAGITTRHFDREEKRWMETSLSEGPQPVSGPRDGTWGIPNLESFEREYLRQS